MHVCVQMHVCGYMYVCVQCTRTGGQPPVLVLSTDYIFSLNWLGWLASEPWGSSPTSTTLGLPAYATLPSFLIVGSGDQTNPCVCKVSIC